MTRKPNSQNCALTGVPGAELIRRSGSMQPIGEIYRSADGWKSYAGYEIPAEFRGTWGLRTEAIFAINEADRLYKGETEGGYLGPI